MRILLTSRLTNHTQSKKPAICRRSRCYRSRNSTPKHHSKAHTQTSLQDIPAGASNRCRHAQKENRKCLNRGASGFLLQLELTPRGWSPGVMFNQFPDSGCRETQACRKLFRVIDSILNYLEQVNADERNSNME